MSNRVNFGSKPRHLTCPEKSIQRADPMISGLVRKKGTKFSVRKIWDRPPPVYGQPFTDDIDIKTLCKPDRQIAGVCFELH